LFENHADLLKEFTQFLPDMGQANASSAAPRSNKRSAPEKTAEKNNASARAAKREAKQLAATAEKPKDASRKDRRKKETIQNKPQEKQTTPISMPEEEKLGLIIIRCFDFVLVATGTYEELNFFHKLKQRLNNPSVYYEFLKCLNLFSQVFGIGFFYISGCHQPIRTCTFGKRRAC
jgi:histone deacetylase complex regulatory component SIN3